jgi:hypothetical protein
MLKCHELLLVACMVAALRSSSDNARAAENVPRMTAK